MIVPLSLDARLICKNSLDFEIGLYFKRGRLYDPSTGRFLQQDPIGFSSGDPNLYRYGRNNPIKFLDPSGNDALSYIELGALGLVAGLAVAVVAVTATEIAAGAAVLAALVTAINVAIDAAVAIVEAAASVAAVIAAVKELALGINILISGVMGRVTPELQAVINSFESVASQFGNDNGPGGGTNPNKGSNPNNGTDPNNSDNPNNGSPPASGCGQ